MYLNDETHDTINTLVYTTKKHEYHFNTPNTNTDRFVNALVDILVSSILTSKEGLEL